MSSSLDRAVARQRNRANMALSRLSTSYWLPLAITAAAAIAGIATWMLTQPRESSSTEKASQRRLSDSRSGKSSAQGRQDSVPSIEREQGEDIPSVVDDETKVTPQSAISDGDEDSYATENTEKAEEEAQARTDAEEAKQTKRKAQQIQRSQQRQTRTKKKLVAVVVSTDPKDQVEDEDGDDDSVSNIQSSILSRLYPHIDAETTQLVVLLYAPTLRSHPASSSPTKSSGAAEDDESSVTSTYEAVNEQAQSLVSHETHVLPFTTPSGHVHILRHMTPSVVYVQESLCGHNGELVDMINGWVGQIMVVVDENSHDAGYITVGDANGIQREKWWMNERKVGRGRGVEVVEGHDIGQDWKKRIAL